MMYKQIFTLIYYMKLSFIEIYNFPIGLRNWMINELIKQKEEEARIMQKGSKK